MQTRLEHVRAALREQHLAALLITEPANRGYVSGFSGSAGVLLVTADHAVLFTDFRYHIRAGQEAPAFEVHQITPTMLLPALLAKTAAELGLHQIGFEAHHVTVEQYHKFQAAIDEQQEAHWLDLVPVTNVVEPLREVKDANEIATLRQAVAITDAAFAAVLPHLTPQHTERQAAWLLEVAMRERGAEAVAFPIIVAAGRNSAQPHAEAGDTPLGTGQPIVIDMGACYQGYHADMTRTVVLGEPDERFWQVYNTVLAAQQHAASTIRPGMTGEAADALARDYLSEAGYGEAFGHSLGHGVGLHIHEGPSLRRTSEQMLRTGNIFSVEPGVYLEDWGGVRIEDLVLLHEDGCEVLTQTSKEPVVILP